MRIVAQRSDGALHLAIGGGLSVILKGDRISKPLDESEVLSMNGWTPTDTSADRRRVVEKQAERARHAPMQFFQLGMSFDEQRERVLTALRAKLGYPASGGYGSYPMSMGEPYIPQNGIGEDWVVYCINGKYFGYVFSIDSNGVVTIEGTPVEVHSTWESMEPEDVEPKKPRAEATSTTFDEAIELRQTEWFKKFMASKAKALTSMPGSLPNLSDNKYLTAKYLADMPGSLPNFQPAGTGHGTDMPRSLPNLSDDDDDPLNLEWDEGAHPRADDGKFAGSGGAGSGGADKADSNPSAGKSQKEMLAEDADRVRQGKEPIHKEALTTAYRQNKSEGASSGPRFSSDHQNAFQSRLDKLKTDQAAMGHNVDDIMSVTTVQPTPTGLRYKTIDGHAANAINRIADRAGHKNTQRYDNKKGHYIVHVSTSKKK